MKAQSGSKQSETLSAFFFGITQTMSLITFHLVVRLYIYESYSFFWAAVNCVPPVLAPLGLRQWLSPCWLLWGGGGCLTAIIAILSVVIGFLGIVRPGFLRTNTIEKMRRGITFTMSIPVVFLLGVLTFMSWLNLRCHNGNSEQV